MDSRSDLELWRLARADPDAFGVLFERHGRAVIFSFQPLRISQVLTGQAVKNPGARGPLARALAAAPD
jgi:hypothetical protein